MQFCSRLEKAEEILKNKVLLLKFQNSSDLEGLIQVMIVTFGEQPPVYAKPRESNVPYPTTCK